jgi:protein-S-isoprenylcysteine O-methyltransferase Ste14
MVAVRTLVFTVLVPGMVGGLLPWLLAQGAMPPWPSAWTVVCLLLAALGVGLYLWCAGAFTFIGKGTPAPFDAPKTLVAQGPYRWVRNPMCLAVLAVTLGQALLFRSWLLVGYGLLFWIVVHLFLVFVEEPSLPNQFGSGYEAYMRCVPRWIPRPGRRAS